MIDNVPSWPLELKTSLRLGSNAAASECCANNQPYAASGERFGCAACGISERK
jgi:hypothetical protein